MFILYILSNSLAASTRLAAFTDVQKNPNLQALWLRCLPYMHEWRLPGVGYVKFEWSDYLYLTLGLAFIGYAILNVVTGPLDGLTIGLAAFHVLTGLALCTVTIHQGRRRVLWEEWVNPISQLEAIRRHAMFEVS